MRRLTGIQLGYELARKRSEQLQGQFDAYVPALRVSFNERTRVILAWLRSVIAMPIFIDVYADDSSKGKTT
jgi:hypothetical protein